MSLDIVSCPECGEVAEVTRRDWLASTDGPVEHVYVRCVQHHWFLLPAEALARVCTGPSPGGRESRMRFGTSASR